MTADTLSILLILYHSEGIIVSELSSLVESAHKNCLETASWEALP